MAVKILHQWYTNNALYSIPYDSPTYGLVVFNDSYGGLAQNLTVTKTSGPSYDPPTVSNNGFYSNIAFTRNSSTTTTRTYGFNAQYDFGNTSDVASFTVNQGIYTTGSNSKAPLYVDKIKQDDVEDIYEPFTFKIYSKNQLDVDNTGQYGYDSYAINMYVIGDGSTYCNSTQNVGYIEYDSYSGSYYVYDVVIDGYINEDATYIFEIVTSTGTVGTFTHYTSPKGSITIEGSSTMLVGDYQARTYSRAITTTDMNGSLEISSSSTFDSGVTATISDGNLVITTTENITNLVRDAVIYVAGSDSWGNWILSEPFYFEQCGTPYTFEFDNAVEYVNGRYGIQKVVGYTLTGTNNDTVTATTNVAWITNLSVDTTNKEVTYTVAANPSNADRAGTVTITGLDMCSSPITAVQTVHQYASPSLEVTPRTSSIYNPSNPTIEPGPLNVAYNVGTVTFRADATRLQSYDISSFTCTDSSIQNLNYDVIQQSYGYDLEIHLPNNNATGATARTFTIYTVGTPVSGEGSASTLSSYIYIRQEAQGGELDIEWTNDFLCGYPATYNNPVTFSNINEGTLQATLTSGNLVYTALYYVNDSTSGPIIHLNLDENDSNATRSGVITLSADDYAGNHLTKTWTISQTSISDNSYQNQLSPTTTQSDPMIVAYDGSITASYETYRTNGVNSVWDYYTNPVAGFTETQTTDGYDVTIQFPTNNTWNQISYLLRISWINDYTLGNCKNGDWDNVGFFTQKGQPGIVRLTGDSSYTKPGIPNGFQIPITTDHCSAPFTAHCDADWLSISFDGSNCQVQCNSQNRTKQNRTTTLYITCTDYQGDTVSSNVITITQLPYCWLEFTNPNPTIIIGQDVTTVTLETDEWGVSNVTPSFSGDLEVVNYTLTEITDGHRLVITVGSNDLRAYKQLNVTLRGTDLYNQSKSDSRTIKKEGLDGLITLTPTTKILPKTASTFTATTVAEGMGGLTCSPSGDVTYSRIGGQGVGNTKNWEFDFNTNWTNDTIYGVITIYGNDYKGKRIEATLNVTQYAVDSSIEITPESRTLEYGENTATYTVTTQYVENVQLSITGNNTFITNTSLSGGVLTITTADFTEKTIKTATITISGTAILGNTISDTVTLTKNGPDGTIVLSPNTKNIIKTASSFEIDITRDGIDSTTMAVTSSGNIVFSSLAFNSNKTKVIAYYETNSTSGNLTGTISVSGTDYKGKLITSTVAVTQYPYDSVLNVTPSTQTLDYGENTATYTVESLFVDNIQINTNGDTSFITNTTLSNGTLTVTTADFSTKVAKTATIIVSGTSIMGNTLSSSVTLTKYGPDGTITVSPDTLTFPKSPKNKTVTVSTSGITGSLTVTSSGTVSFSSLTLNGTTLTVYTNENLTSGNLTGTITITGTDYKGKTITANIPVTQNPYDSYIRLTPATRTVDKNSGTTTYSVETDSMDSTTLRANSTGTSVSNVSLTGNTVTVQYSESTIVANKVNTIYVTGTDIYGNSVRGDAELIQTGVDPTVTANTLNIGWDEGTATAFVATNGVGNISVSFSGNVTITDYSISETSGGYNITIITPDNSTNTVYHSVATVTGTVTEGQYEGQTRTTTFNVNKYGKEGVVTIEPTAKTIRKVGATVEFDVSLINMDLSTVTASTGTFNSDKTKLTVTVGQNPNSSDRTINVVVSGTDFNGTTKSATAVITQYGVDPYISITPASRVIGSTVSSTSFSVSTYKVTGIEVEVEGTINVTDYQLSGNTLTITSTDNTDQFQKTALIVISGTDDLGDPIEARATLIKAGRGGGIVVNGDYVIPSNGGSLAIEYGLEDIDPNTIVVSTSGDIDVTGIVVDRENRVAVITYGPNSSANPKTGKIFITGLGDDGLTKLAMIDLTQLGSAYKITINPATANVAYSSTSSSATVTSTGIASTTFEYSGSLEPSSCTFTKDASNSGTINATYSANNTDEYKRLYMTINGITTDGSNVTSSAVINQGIDPSSGPYIFLLQPASQAVKVVEAAQTTVSYLINSIKGYDEIDYSITGFILSGRWGTRPYADGKRVVVPLNTHSEERNVKVIYTQDISLNTLTPMIFQQEGVEPDVNPIWKEFSTSANVNDFVEYHIKLGSDIIYAGKAYKYPDATKVTWSINDAVSNYLGNGLSFVEGIQQIPDYSKDFYMEDNLGNKYVETFYNSWAYNDTDYWLSDPIDYRVDPRQWLPVSFLSTNYETINVGGRTYAALKENDGWTVMTHLNNFLVDCDSGFQVIGAESDRLTYRVAKGDYVLYYSNAYGGWDSLLCNGTSKKTDNIEHLTYRRKSRNQADFSKINYQNNITPTWSLKTGITVDGQKMYHLLESTMVYLHNLETDQIIPVVITNSNCEYLNYTNNGKKPYFYNITVEESNQKLRK